MDYLMTNRFERNLCFSKMPRAFLFSIHEYSRSENPIVIILERNKYNQRAAARFFGRAAADKSAPGAESSGS